MGTHHKEERRRVTRGRAMTAFRGMKGFGEKPKKKGVKRGDWQGRFASAQVTFALDDEGKLRSDARVRTSSGPRAKC